ncbi:MAG: cytochrome c-type biogenesis protein [Gammaproteobacteria bacterium]
MVLLLGSSLCMAADTPYEFSTPQQAARYQRLLEELRCLVCQNQSLSDSHAELAQDLRDEVYRMMNEDLSDEEIRGFMVARYGDFVLYKPPIKKSTFLLWFGPFALILIALTIVWRSVSRQRESSESLTAEELEFAASLKDKPSQDERIDQ